MTAMREHAIRPRTLTAIMEAAIRLLNANVDATMSDVARAAGVGRATLHRHFRTKADLLRAVGECCIEEMNRAVRAVDDAELPASDRLQAMLRAVIPLGDRYAFLQFDTSGDEILRAGYEAQLDWTTALVEDLKTEGVIGQDVPTRWAVAQIDQLVWVAWTAVSEWGLSPERTATLAQRTLLNGLGAL
ncbi:MAG: helix-turn-helix domain containing protein [Gammaproteobacteria bacterium]|nr:helix-turn-helix domain containing protein [Gammaproteobacteria bacterium]